MIAGAALIAAVALGAGYWWGRTAPAMQEGASVPATAESKAGAQPDATSGKRVLHYRNPMGLPDTSPTPKKDSMGMDYVPVYEGEEPAAGGSDIRIRPARVQKLGVRVEPVVRGDLARVVRAAGRVEPDERRTYAISPKFEGWVERLHVNATGQPVSRGQPLFDVYSPELVSVQREYAIATRGRDMLKDAPEETRNAMQRLAEASLARMRNWDLPDDQVASLARGGEVRRTVTFRSPVSGVVTERKALQGMRFMPGDSLYQVTDLSAVWVIADVFEQDLALVRTGSTAKLAINAYPERTFTGRVSYVYPTLTAETRTIPVRIELSNPGGTLKPGMYASVELTGAGRRNVLAVPSSAIIDSGVRQIVIVQNAEGRFAAREVKLGMRADDRVEVMEGVKEGEAVVTAANFLIDAESNLRAAVGALSSGAGVSAAAPGAEATGKVGPRASGRVDAVDAKSGTATISHGPIESLKWPAMTMDFTLTNASQLAGVASGSEIEFEFVERKPGEYVITRVVPKGAVAKPASAPPAQHSGKH